ncbi:hypothetical protein [Nonomuraea indica]|uniref:hypothetical protein n=1 Tax=Nonomuraea indica TaxID=1581193 RepID=UPI000C7B68BA|nr:hypothetical protein [Nonomuraea indica]
MFKRRIAVLGAVGVLVLTGLAGSALADETPAPAGSKVVCRTSDGQVIAFAERVKAIEARKGPDGSILVAEAEPPTAVRVSDLAAEQGTAHRVERRGGPDLEKGHAATAVPAEPAVGADGKPVPAPVGPDGKPVSAPVGPDGEPLVATAVPVGPDGKPLQAPVGPDGKPVPAPEGAETVTCTAE